MENNPIPSALCLRDRINRLYDAMVHDPDRPFWQVETVSILLSLIECIVLSADEDTSDAQLSDISTRVGSLESRYSELLYHLKSSR